QALVAEGLTDEATGLAARALPLMKGSTAQWQALDMLSQLWAKVGDTTRAALLLACADAMHRLHGFARKPHAVRARNALLEHFADVLPDVVIRRALAEGGDMDEDEAVALALGFAAPSANG